MDDLLRAKSCIHLCEEPENACSDTVNVAFKTPLELICTLDGSGQTESRSLANRKRLGTPQHHRSASIQVTKQRTRRITMPARHTRDSATPSRETTESPKGTTISARDVGVTLKVSDKALKELDRIQEEAIKAAQEDPKFSWR